MNHIGGSREGGGVTAVSTPPNFKFWKILKKYWSIVESKEKKEELYTCIWRKIMDIGTGGGGGGEKKGFKKGGKNFFWILPPPFFFFSKKSFFKKGLFVPPPPPPTSS